MAQDEVHLQGETVRSQVAQPVQSKPATAFWLVAYALSMTIMGNNIPAPLYPVYQQLWHFSTGLLTVVFAVVAVGVFPALLFLGPLSDVRGRRPILLLGVAIAIAGTIVFTLLGTSAATQLLCRKWPIRRNLLVGPISLLVGLLVFVTSLPLENLALFLLGIIITGFGQGLTYLGSQELVSRIVTPQQRGEVFSVFNLIVYLGASAAALGVGFGADILGFFGATATVVAIICLLALLAAIAGTRSTRIRQS